MTVTNFDAMVWVNDIRLSSDICRLVASGTVLSKNNT